MIYSGTSEKRELEDGAPQQLERQLPLHRRRQVFEELGRDAHRPIATQVMPQVLHHSLLQLPGHVAVSHEALCVRGALVDLVVEEATGGVREHGDDGAEEERRDEHGRDSIQPRYRSRRGYVTVSHRAHRHGDPVNVPDVVFHPGDAQGAVDFVHALGKLPTTSGRVRQEAHREHDLERLQTAVVALLLQPLEGPVESSKPQELQDAGQQRPRVFRRPQHQGPRCEHVGRQPAPYVVVSDGRRREVKPPVPSEQARAEVDQDVQDPDDVHTLEDRQGHAVHTVRQADEDDQSHEERGDDDQRIPREAKLRVGREHPVGLRHRVRQGGDCRSHHCAARAGVLKGRETDLLLPLPPAAAGTRVGVGVALGLFLVSFQQAVEAVHGSVGQDTVRLIDRHTALRVDVLRIILASHRADAPPQRRRRRGILLVRLISRRGVGNPALDAGPPPNIQRGDV
mmetsp:Transcript_50441/g.141151  ORF Transcript_50441/g.141151 Transcript_50441/m.141151 type:complete len:454 (-) Transcript_50441:837-2198(-)